MWQKFLNVFRSSPKKLINPIDNFEEIKNTKYIFSKSYHHTDTTIFGAISKEQNFLPKNEQEQRFLPFCSHLEGVYVEINNSAFYFAKEHLFDGQNNVWYHKGIIQSQIPVFRQKLPFFAKKYKGTVAYLTNTSTCLHYGHWLRLVLPSLRIYEQEIGLENIDYFYVGDNIPPRFVYETLRFWSILPNKIIYNPCKADKYVAFFSYWERQNGKYGYLDKQSFWYVREKILSQMDLKQNCCYVPNVYIARGDVSWRKVINEQNLLKILKKYDYEYRKMDNLSVEEQAKIFYFAKNIIAPHGSALTNLLFCNEKTSVLEFFSKNHLCHTSYTLASYAGMNYGFKQDDESNIDQKTDNFFEDLEISEKYLEQWIIGSRERVARE